MQVCGAESSLRWAPMLALYPRVNKLSTISTRNNVGPSTKIGEGDAPALLTPLPIWHIASFYHVRSSAKLSWEYTQWLFDDKKSTTKVQAWHRSKLDGWQIGVEPRLNGHSALKCGQERLDELWTLGYRSA